jgi:hypothetical protein
MVGLNPVLSCLMSIEDSITRGDAVRDALMQWLDRENSQQNHYGREFHRELLEFCRKTERRDDNAFEVSNFRCETLFRQSLLTVLLDGFDGNSVLPRLRELRTEVENQLELDMKAHVESLPLKMLVPLLLCMFPAFLILLLGPITQNFMEALL